MTTPASSTSLSAARAALTAPEREREPAWRTLLAAATACLTVLGFCIVVLTQAAPDASAVDGALGLRQPLSR